MVDNRFFVVVVVMVNNYYHFDSVSSYCSLLYVRNSVVILIVFRTFFVSVDNFYFYFFTHRIDLLNNFPVLIDIVVLQKINNLVKVSILYSGFIITNYDGMVVLDNKDNIVDDLDNNCQNSIVAVDDNILVDFVSIVNFFDNILALIVIFIFI